MDKNIDHLSLFINKTNYKVTGMKVLTFYKDRNVTSQYSGLLYSGPLNSLLIKEIISTFLYQEIFAS